MRTIFLVILLIAVAGPASAQELSPDIEAEARAAFAEGERQFEAGNHQLALDAFQRMHDLMAADPGAQAMVSYNIALCLDRLGRVEEAMATYERFLAETPPDAPYRQRANDRVRELRGRAEFRADRAPEESGDEGQAEAPQREPASGSVMVPIGITITSLGVAALLTAVPTGLLALDGEAQLEAACPGGACPAEEQGRIDETQMLGIVTDVLWVSGALIATAGVSLLLLGLIEDGDGVGEVARVTMDVGCTLQSCVAHLGGQF